jgi:hypothetical protein
MIAVVAVVVVVVVINDGEPRNGTKNHSFGGKQKQEKGTMNIQSYLSEGEDFWIHSFKPFQIEDLARIFLFAFHGKILMTLTATTRTSGRRNFHGALACCYYYFLIFALVQ